MFLDVPLASSRLFPHYERVDKGEDLHRIGHAVEARRGELGMTQQDLADAAGVDLKTVYNLESGGRWPIARTRAAIAAALGWEPDALTVLAVGGVLDPDTPARPPLSVVPSPPESLELGPDDILPDMDQQMRQAVRVHVDGLRKVYRLVVLKGPDVPGSAFFSEPHEAERWNRLVEAGYAEKPGKGYSPLELIWLIAMGRVFDDQYRAAASRPDRARKALIRVT